MISLSLFCQGNSDWLFTQYPVAYTYFTVTKQQQQQQKRPQGFHNVPNIFQTSQCPIRKKKDLGIRLVYSNCGPDSKIIILKKTVKHIPVWI